MKFILKPAFLAFAGALALSACASAPGGDKPAAASKKAAENITAIGAFGGENDHVVTGKATISKVDGQWIVTLDEDFSLDGAPDPEVGFGDGDGYVKGTSLGKLQKLAGSQSYVVPASLDVGDYTQVYIWCEQFTVPLGHADLTIL